jgi:hypothetical protein
VAAQCTSVSRACVCVCVCDTTSLAARWLCSVHPSSGLEGASDAVLRKIDAVTETVLSSAVEVLRGGAESSSAVVPVSVALLTTALDWRGPDLATLHRAGVVDALAALLATTADVDKRVTALALEVFHFLVARCVAIEVGDAPHRPPPHAVQMTAMLELVRRTA